MRHLRIASALSIILAIAVVAGLYASLASASATFVVTRDDDPAVDGCDTNGCTFREAIIAANQANGGTIDLGSHQVSLDQGAVTISAADLTIEGDGPAQASVGGGGTVVMHVASPANVAASGFKVTGGQSGDCGSGILNDGILDLQNMEVSGNTTTGTGGGICNTLTLTIENSTISNNHAQGSPAGGGIYNSGTMTIEHSTISGNVALGTSGGGNGGGIGNTGTATVEYTTIDGNSGSSSACDDCSSGAGIMNATDATLNLNWSTVSNNDGDTGAGLLNSGTATIMRSTFSGNEAGAMLNNSHAHMSIAYSTISGNIGDPYPKNGVGGISNYGTLSLTNDTIANNTAMQYPYGGLFTNTTGGSDFKATIFANNGSKNCSSSGTHTSVGYNLLTEDSCGPIGSDQVVADAMLSALQDNGGPTQTILPLAGSPAIDHGGPSCSGVEQRGAPHVNGCDVGATEFGSTPPTPTPSPSPTPAPQAFPIGDANCSDDVTATDLGELLKLADGLTQPSQCGRTTLPCFNFNGACFPVWVDTNCDQQVTGADGLPVLYYLIGQTQTIPDCTQVGQYPGFG